MAGKLQDALLESTAETARASSREDEWDRRLSVLGLRRVQVPGDGNCLFTALCMQAGRMDAGVCRQKVAQELDSASEDSKNIQQARLAGQSDRGFPHKPGCVDAPRWHGEQVIHACPQIHKAHFRH